MTRPSPTTSRATLALVAMLAIGGCSSLPTGPRPEASSDAGATGAGMAGTVGANPTPIPLSPATSSKTLYAAIGGRVTAGSFTVVLPPFALAGNATVTVTQPDRSKPYVSLHISPASANKFRLPATLIVNASALSAEKLGAAYVGWFNPSTRGWEPMAGSKVNLESRTVLCPLMHFSEYAVQVDGKAGW